MPTGTVHSFDTFSDITELAGGARGSNASAEIFSQRTGTVSSSMSADYAFTDIAHLPTSDLLVRRSPGDPGYGGTPLVTIMGSIMIDQGLEWMVYQPGAYYQDIFTVVRPDTGSVSDADVDPVFAVYRRKASDGTMEVSGAMAISFTHEDTGRYAIYGTIPSSWAKGDTIQVSAQVVIAGKTQKIPVSSFVLAGAATVGQVW